MTTNEPQNAQPTPATTPLAAAEATINGVPVSQATLRNPWGEPQPETKKPVKPWLTHAAAFAGGVGVTAICAAALVGGNAAGNATSGPGGFPGGAPQGNWQQQGQMPSGEGYFSGGRMGRMGGMQGGQMPNAQDSTGENQTGQAPMGQDSTGTGMQSEQSAWFSDQGAAPRMLELTGPELAELISQLEAGEQSSRLQDLQQQLAETQAQQTQQAEIISNYEA